MDKWICEDCNQGDNQNTNQNIESQTSLLSVISKGSLNELRNELQNDEICSSGKGIENNLIKSKTDKVNNPRCDLSN